jgi:DNA-binding response OmpR family regulator
MVIPLTSDVSWGWYEEVARMYKGSKILVIDDDPIYVKSTTAILESHGYRVEHAGDGKEGLSRIRECKPDLVLLDVMMSWVLDGVALTETMMHEKEMDHIPIIMVSSIRHSEYGGLFPDERYLHIDTWLDKPCPPTQLVATIEATLSRREKYRSYSQRA